MVLKLSSVRLKSRFPSFKFEFESKIRDAVYFIRRKSWRVMLIDIERLAFLAANCHD